MPFSHTFSITSPANTTKPNAKKDPKTLRAGSVIMSARLHVPLGHQAQVPVWLERDGAQVIPTDQTEIKLDDVPDLELLAYPIRVPRETMVALAGYNQDAVNQHTTRLFMTGLYPEEARIARGRTVDFDALRDLNVGRF